MNLYICIFEELLKIIIGNDNDYTSTFKQIDRESSQAEEVILNYYF
jgi:hypothetical protein